METQKPPLHILITGAAGFIGQALASAIVPSLLSPSSNSKTVSLTLTDISKPRIPQPLLKFTKKTTSVASNLTDPSNVSEIIKPEMNVIYILHGLMSSASEANLDLSLKVNIDSIRNILDVLREQRSAAHSHGTPPIKVIFASSTAVYGPPVSDDETITERTAPDPRSSYGAQKHVAETLINDFSRQGLVDGRIVRLPTVGGTLDLDVGYPSLCASRYSFAQDFPRAPPRLSRLEYSVSL